jgi:uncharacterized protein (TIGR02246 family)
MQQENTMRMICVLCLDLVSLLALGAAPRNTDEDAIRAVVDRLMEAWNRHDAHAFAAVFAQDADFTNVIGMGAHGRDKIEEFHAPMFSSLFKNSHQDYTEIKVRFIRPDVATVDVRWHMTGATDPQGNPRPNREGLLNFMATKNKGAWQILVLHNTELTKQGK